MRHAFAVTSALVIWTFISGPARLSAQQVSSFELLQVLVKPGDSIEVIGTDGKSSRGKIESLSNVSLRLRTKGILREFTQGETAEIKQRRGDSLSNGAWAGLVSGGIFGGLIAISGVSCGDCGGDGAFAVAAVSIYGGIGAAIGVGIDALFTHRQTVYRTPVRTVLNHLRVTPLLANDRKGVALRFAF